MTDPGRTTLRDRVAAALYERERPPRDPHWPEAFAADREVFEAMADAVLAVLPPPADRAAVLLWAADFAEEVAEKLRAHHEFERSNGALDVMTELRRMADGAPDEHVCRPDASVYLCPTSGETESDCHGGFNACCDRPDLHRPAAGAGQDGAQQ